MLSDRRRLLSGKGSRAASCKKAALGIDQKGTELAKNARQKGHLRLINQSRRTGQYWANFKRYKPSDFDLNVDCQEEGA